MIRELKKEERQLGVELSFQLSQNPKTNSYSLKNSRKEVEDYLGRVDLRENDRLLGAFDENGILKGVFYLCVIPEERYFQTGACYVETEVTKYMDQLMEYLSPKYKGYQGIFGYPKENQEMVSYFRRKSAKQLDSAENLWIRKKELKIEKDNPHVIQLKEEDLEEYEEVHDSFFPHVYWTGKRLKENFQKWKVFVIKEEERIVAASFINDQGKNGEIFGLACLQREDKDSLKTLLGEMLMRCFQQENWACVMFFVEDEEPVQNQVAKELGFWYYNSYISFEMRF